MLVHFAHTLAFVTQTMSKYGAQPNLTASMWDQPPGWYGQHAYANAFESAWGYVWHAPGPDERPTTRGLGNGISWGFEPSFCEAILPTIREHSPAYASGVTCDDLKAATRRALSAWSLNNDAIVWYELHPAAECPTVFNLTARESVREATKQCNAGMLPVDLAGACESPLELPVGVARSNCPLTEVMIGARNDKGQCTYGNCSNGYLPWASYCDNRRANECGTTPAREDGYYAERLANFSSEFDSTRSTPAGASAQQYAMYDSCNQLGPGCVLPPLRAPNGFSFDGHDYTRRIETYGGVITLNRDDCFYLDATFCRGALASAAESSAKARHRQPCLRTPPHHLQTLPSHLPPLPTTRVRARRRVASATTSRR